MHRDEVQVPVEACRPQICEPRHYNRAATKHIIGKAADKRDLRRFAFICGLEIILTMWLATLPATTQ